MLLRNFKTYVAGASDDQDICVVVNSSESGQEIVTTYDIVADINEYGELIISIALEPNYAVEKCDDLYPPRRLEKKPQIGYPPNGKTFTGIDWNLRLDCIRLFDYSCCLGFISSFSYASGVIIDLGINDTEHKISKRALVCSINTQANRRETVKALKICLSAIRDNEMLFLEKLPEYMWFSEQVAFGCNAVKIIGEVIDMLGSIY